MTLALTALVAGVLAAPLAWPDDTEVFVSQYNAGGASGRPKVLVVFDTSGSMGTVALSEKPAYDPATTYPQLGGIRSDRLYWSRDGEPPDPSRSSEYDQYVTESLNRCAESYTTLTTYGTFTGRVGYYQDNRRQNRRQWVPLDDDVHSPPHVDCAEDVEALNMANGPGEDDGYPRDRDPQRYDGYTDGPTQADHETQKKTDWDQSNFAVALFTANYVNWYYNTAIVTERTRLDIAKDVLQETINTSPSVDFGLMVFNENGTSSGNQVRNGGRVIYGVPDNMTEAQKTQLLTTVAGMNDGGWTPLCETYYEAYRYIAGQGVWYGDDDASSTPQRDTAVEDGGEYISPLADCQYLYVIFVTDGLPTYDTMANSAIETLTGKTCGNYQYDSGQGNLKNCLPTLAEYLYQTDLDGDPDNGAQKVVTYTIGFHTNQTLLSDAAEKGGGDYFTADSAAALSSAFRGAITQILSVSTSFTAPSVAVDSFQRTFHRDDVFMAMFEPRGTAEWPGNIKKLKLNSNGVLVDADGGAAIDPATGRIKETSRTFWSTQADGDTVDAGGVGGVLAARDPATRVIKSNTGSGGVLETFTPANIDAAAFGLAADDDLYSLFGVADATELTELINWARGFDIEDEDGDGNTTEPRPWILGDMLHSRPVAVNYGARGSYTQSNPDVRLLVGTNAGFVHMFGAADNDGAEDWAFFPKELAPNLVPLRDNALSVHPYGVDNTIAIYKKDWDLDGTIETPDQNGQNDIVWAYITLRRGGERIYAMDISNPDLPSFMWTIDDSTTGFEELGQTWSIPVAAYIPGYETNAGSPKPVVIFGAGYDLNKDSDGLVTTDSVGRGIFIVDAETGARVWSVTPAATDIKNKHSAALLHSIAVPVTVLDSNADGRVDRVYAPDTGGNIWRVDLPGNSLPTAGQTEWVLTQVAALNGGSAATDRRFFNRIDLARARHHTEAFDALVIGSGNRPSPLDTGVTDRFYMIQDTRLYPISSAASIPSSCGALAEGVPARYPNCLTPIDDDDLYDATANLVQDGSEEQKTAALNDLFGKAGWRVDLQGGDYSGGTGEKSLSAAVTIDGVVWFTTFEPLAANADLCTPRGGNGYLYAVNLVDARAEFDFTFNGVLSKPDRRVSLFVPGIPDTPAVHFGEDNKIRLLFPSGGGPIPTQVGNPLTEVNGKGVGERIVPSGVSWYLHDPQ